MSLQEQFQLAISDGDVNAVRNLVTRWWSNYQNRLFEGNAFDDGLENTLDVTKLFVASLKIGNVEISELLLELRPAPSSRFVDTDGKRLIHLATEVGNLNIVKKIVSMGCLINVYDYAKVSPIMIAVTQGFADITDFLIQKGGKVNDTRSRKESDGSSLLDLSVQAGYYDVASVLIKRGADLDYQSPPSLGGGGGLTALHNAVLGGKTDIVKLLCDNGADVTIKDSVGSCPLHLAAHSGLIDIVKALLEEGADIELLDAKRRSPLHRAVMGKSLKVAEFLIKLGANVCAIDGKGCQPLHEAAAMGQDNIVNLLLNNGAQVNATTDTESSPLMEACLAGSPEVVEMLIVHDADVNMGDASKRTALHKAQICAKDISVKENISLQLIAAGAKISPVDNNSYTPLHNLVFQCVVRGSENYEAVRIFIRFGANLIPDIQQPRGQVDIFAPDFTLQSFANYRNSPLCSLTWNGFYKTARFLVLAGWDLQRENWLDLPGKSPEHDEFLAWLREFASNPSLLSILCRNRIRQILSNVTDGREVLTSIQTLPLPSKIKSFLTLEYI